MEVYEINENFVVMLEILTRQSWHHIESSSLICRTSQLIGCSMMETLAFNELAMMSINKANTK